MACNSCGRDSPEGASFCGNCGAVLHAKCSRCGAANQPGQRFCGSCGESLQGISKSATVIAPAIEERVRRLPETIGGKRYTVLKLLGEGGSKVVYLARDNRLDRDVAIAMRRIEGLDHAGQTRVMNEARAMGRLGDHPNIVTVYDIGDEAGQPYIVSQYMEGGTLDDLLRRSPGRRLPLGEALRISEQVCEALEYAHAAGIVHRDVKPANVFLTHDEQAKLGDFGSAIAPEQLRLTIKGMMVGTAAYMPPEQTQTARSDLYSFGATLYEMLTGRTPFLADNFGSMMLQHLRATPASLCTMVGDVPVALDALVLKLLEKDPSDRPANATAVKGSLRTMMDEELPPRSFDRQASARIVEGANLSSQAIPDGTTSVMYLDVENGATIVENIGNSGAQAVMTTYSSLVRAQAQLQRGFEVRSVDNSFVLGFTSARRALLCAVSIQRAISQYAWTDLNQTPQVRIGLSSQSIQDTGDAFAKAVILAAKIGAATPGGAILVSAAFKEATESSNDFRFDKGRDLYLQGLAGAYRVYGVEWKSTSNDLFSMPASRR
jgi:serine/threonine protein kinase